MLSCPADEINHGEDSSYPAAATTIRLYDPAGTLVNEILPPSGLRFGPAAWNADGSILAFTVGDLGEPVMNQAHGLPERRHRSRAVYGWRRS